MNSLESLIQSSTEKSESSVTQATCKRNAAKGEISQKRSISGAISAVSKKDNINDTDMLTINKHLEENVNVPPCPEQYCSFIENTSLEHLVFWKLEKLVDSLSIATNAANSLELLSKVVAHVEKPLFALVLRKTAGNLSNAAQFLGCNRNTLHRKLKELNIMPKDLRQFLRSKRIKRLTSISRD